MLFPEQVIPFLQHDDPIVRDHALRYFRDSYASGSLTADHYWAVIDRFGENDDTIGFAAQLDDVPQTDASVRRLTRALAGKSLENFEFQYQHAAGAMDLTVLARNRNELLSCPQLLPHVRERLELRLSLLEQNPATAWDRLMQHGRELGWASVGSFNTAQGDALCESAARGGPTICQRALLTLADVSAADDWRQIFAARVLSLARYEPAVDPLVQKLSFDDDVLRDEVNRVLARIGTPDVIDRIIAFYPGKPWDVRLFASGSLGNIKRPESVSALVKLVDLELALESDPSHGDEDSLVDHLLTDLTRLGSLAGLYESERLIAAFPNHPEALDLCQCLLATAVMTDVVLPEEKAWRSRIKSREARRAAGMRNVEAMSRDIRERWRKTGIPFPERPQSRQEAAASSVARAVAPVPVAPVSQAYAERLEPIRNTAPKIGRNDPCPCGSRKKYKKCCGK
jgi:uncharacterized protein YecA (UPF0149 family)